MAPLDRVYQEIAILKKLDHVNIVKLIEVSYCCSLRRAETDLVCLVARGRFSNCSYCSQNCFKMGIQQLGL